MIEFLNGIGPVLIAFGVCYFDFEGCHIFTFLAVGWAASAIISSIFEVKKMIMQSYRENSDFDAGAITWKNAKSIVVKRSRTQRFWAQFRKLPTRNALRRAGRAVLQVTGRSAQFHFLAHVKLRHYMHRHSQIPRISIYSEHLIERRPMRSFSTAELTQQIGAVI
jgi:hypothetical protein